LSLWTSLVENQWTTFGEYRRISLGENEWPRLGENTWTIIARKMTLDAQHEDNLGARVIKYDRPRTVRL
jgi:hypothetical protein